MDLYFFLKKPKTNKIQQLPCPAPKINQDMNHYGSFPEDT